MPNIYGAARIAKGITQERAADAIPCSVRSLADYQIYDFADAREDRRLITIAKDGVIDNTERPEFDRIVSKLDEIIQSALAVAYNKGG